MMYMNRLLNIHHVTGSVCHSQSQGIVENMHRTLNSILRRLIEENPVEWESILPYVECVLRSTPLESLGGRSPYQVVTGLVPKMPRAVLQQHGTIPVGIDEYMSRVSKYLKDTYRSVRETVSANQERKEIAAQDDGTLGMELNVGDVVMRRVDQIDKRAGPRRFQPRVKKEMYVVKAKISPHPFKLETYWKPRVEVPGTHNAIDLIRIQLPWVDISETPSRIIEVFKNAEGDWWRYRLEKHAPDGQCYLERMTKGDSERTWVESGVGQWTDLSNELYRWVM